MNKKIVVLIILLAVVVFGFTLVIYKLSQSKPEVSNPLPQNNIKVQSNQSSQQATKGEPKVTETTTDAITGTVTKLDPKTITVYNIESGKTINLPEKVDTYYIDQYKGIMVRDFSEVKKGSRVTVNYNIKSNIAVYIVIEP